MALTLGCSTTRYDVTTEDPDLSILGSVENPNPSIPLSDHLRKLPGVSVQGSGINARVTMRGFKSFSGDPEPLFVLDGKMLTGGYPAAAGAVDVNDIQHIRVLRDINDRSRYGFRGANGVIEIFTKH